MHRFQYYLSVVWNSSSKIHWSCQSSWHNLLRVDETWSEKLKPHNASNSLTFLPLDCYKCYTLNVWVCQISHPSAMWQLTATGISPALLSTIDVMKLSICCRCWLFTCHCPLLVVCVCLLSSFVSYWHMCHSLIFIFYCYCPLIITISGLAMSILHFLSLGQEYDPGPRSMPSSRQWDLTLGWSC